MTTLHELFANPDHYLFAFEGDDAVFVEMDRDAYQRSIFLDRRISSLHAGVWKVGCAALETEMEHQRRPAWGPGFIFHVAHCGSTLLARALDMKVHNLVCREPLPMRQLGMAAGGEHSGDALPDGWHSRLKLAWTLLGRRYHEDAPVIVKANVPVNFMLPQLMALAPDTPAIFLSHSLENYLLAILRSPDHCAWVGTISRELQRGIDAVVGPLEPGTTLAVAAARLWLAQHLLFADALTRFPHTATLDAEDLFNSPKAVLSAAFSHFGQPQNEDTLDEIVRSDLFARYSKNPNMEFNNERRLERQVTLRQQLGQALDDAAAWIARHPASTLLKGSLPKPLLENAGQSNGKLWAIKPK